MLEELPCDFAIFGIKSMLEVLSEILINHRQDYGLWMGYPEYVAYPAVNHLVDSGIREWVVV